MKKILILYCLFNSLFSFGQLEFYSKEDMLDYTYGSISETYLQTGFLLDRNFMLDTIDWEKHKVENGVVTSGIKFEDWFNLYRYLDNAKINPNNIESKDSLIFKTITNILFQDPKTDNITLPLMILNFNIDKFKDNAIDNGHIAVMSDHYDEGINVEDGIEQVHLFTMGLFLDTLFFNNLTLQFDEFYVKNNTGIEILSVDINVKNTNYNLVSGSEVTISNLENGENRIIFSFNLSDGRKINCNYFLLKLAPEPSSNKASTSDLFITEQEADFFDFYDTFGYGDLDELDLENPKLTYCIKYACDNTEQTLKKPVFFISGFNTSHGSVYITKKQQTDCYDLFWKYNIEGLINELRSTGHDIIIVRFIPAAADITKNAILLEFLINLVNSEKFNNLSYFENIIFGYSSGALITRYALDMMEKKHLEGIYNNHHHTKLYASFDGEHQGANLPLGSQFTVNFLSGLTDWPAIHVINYMGNSPQAKQLLKYYRTETGQFGTSYSQGQGPHNMRTVFMDNMENPSIWGHSKQFEKHGYYGYPAFTRNITISNGSNFTNYSSTLIENNPFYFYNGHKIYEHYISGKYIQVFFNNNKRIAGSTGPSTVFYFHKTSGLFGSAYTLFYQTDINLVMYDQAPGGFTFGDQDAQKKVYDYLHFAFPLIPNNSDHYEYRLNSFTPTVSCLDIRNFTPTPTSYQVEYNLHDNELMGITISLDGVITQGDYYGYPNLFHPTNHFQLTPFEAIYCDMWNQIHIGSENMINPPNDSYPDESFILNTDGFPHIKNFLSMEAEHDLVYLQNQNVGWNTNGVEYRAEYEASHSIFIGEEVTRKTDIAPYRILYNGNIACKAEVAIHLTDGFIVETGGVFHAQIAPVSYESCFASSGMVVNNSNTNFETLQYDLPDSKSFLDSENKEKTNEFSLYPNPSNGEITISWKNELIGENNKLWVEMYDLSGKVVFSQYINNYLVFCPELEKGVYLVKAIYENQMEYTKLIIQ